MKLTRILILQAVLFCLSVGAQLQRLPNASLSMPPAPPSYGYTSTNALPGMVFTNPICIVSPPGETNRLFVLSKNGVITVITNLASPNGTTFMDLTPQVSSQNANNGTAGERGLLGMAFHPGFATNGYFFILFMPTNAVQSGYFDRLSRFKVSTGNPNQGDTNSQTVFYDQADSQPNHNAGDIHFGADGYLYISVGDEGREHDGNDRGQIITNCLFSGILRIDVDKRAGNLQPNGGNASLAISTNYLIPADNPFIGITNFNGLTVNSNLVRTEFYAVGLRNPWRWNFDFYTNAFGTNVLYCGDVGQDHYEEVDVIQKGDNLGWAYWEGTNVASGVTSPSTALPHTPYITTNGTQIRFPIVHYAHGSLTNQGNCVIGGVVYRGINLSQLYGSYVYADYVSGNIWTLTASNFTASVGNVSGAVGPAYPIIQDSSLNITAFGTDPRNGDVLFCATKTTTFATAATINKIIYNNATNGAALPPTLYDTGAFTNLMSLTGPHDTLQPAAGILPYVINVPFWSDNAIKSRWFSVPNTNLAIGFNANGNWSFPTGTVWVKHFNLQLTNGDSSSEIRLETRLLVKNAAGVYGVSYRWGGSRTNATLVDTAGMDESFIIHDGATVRTQVWHYPSQNECRTCHTDAGGFGLGFRTEQLNCAYDYGFGSTNQIQALSAAGYFSSPVTNDVTTLLALATATNTSASLEFRARSFLMANCSQCHQPSGTAFNANWDARITTPTALAGLINGSLVNNFGNASNAVIAPHLPGNSVLLTRTATRGAGSIQMPPLASSLVDSTATNLLTQWILSLTNSFWIAVTPDPQTVAPGNNAVYTVSLLATSDFTNDVTLSVSGLPAGATAGFSPTIVNSAITNSTLTISIPGATAQGTYPLTVSGLGGNQTNIDAFGLVVNAVTTAPGALLWTNGGVDLNWSTSLNWTNVTAGGYGPPIAANSVLFTNISTTASAGITNNIVDTGMTISSLQYANNATTPNYHVTLVKAGQALLVTNGMFVGTATDAGANNLVNAVVTGGAGTLIVSNGNFSAQQSSASDGPHQATLDLSGLGTLRVTVSKFGVGVYQLPAGSPRAAGIVYLARTNFITTTSPGVTNGVLINWNANSGGAVNANNKPSALYLGQTNVFHTDAVTIGSVKASYGGLMAFNPSGLNSPVAFFRGTGGDGSRVSLWSIGCEGPLNNSNQNSNGTNDFTGGIIDALINTLVIGQTSTGASGGTISGSGTGVLTLNAGTIDVNTITNGWSLGTGTVTNNGIGIINVNGGVLRINTAFVAAVNTGTGVSGQSSALNINGGTVQANSLLSGGGTNVVTMNNGTLVLTNAARGISVLALTNSTLHLNLNGAASTTNILTASLIASGQTAITVDSVTNVNQATNLPLIAYTSFSGSVSNNFVKGALPNGFSAALVDNAAQHRIDLVIAQSTNVVPRFANLTAAGNNFIFSGSNGLPLGAYYLLRSTNMGLPLNQWTRISTNPFDPNGAFNFTNAAGTNGSLFYLLQLQ